MNILYVSNDPQLFVAKSAVRARMRLHAEALHEMTGGTLRIIARASANQEVSDGHLVLHGVRTGKAGMVYVLTREARRLIRTYDIGIVSAQDPFEHGWVAAHAVRGTSARVHLQVHTDFLSPWFVKGQGRGFTNLSAKLLNLVRIRLAAWAMPKAHGMRSVSVRVRDSIVRAYGDHVPVPSVIPISVPPEIPEAVPLPSAPFSFGLISIGRLEAEKRIEDIIGAVAILKDTYPQLGAYIVNDGRMRERLERLVRESGLEGRVVFLGKRADARALLGSAQAFIQTSAYEGYGLAVAEAALAGVPVVTSDVGIVGDVLNGPEEVLVVPVGDVAGFASCIARLIDDPTAAGLLAQKARERVTEHLAATDSSPHAIITDMLRLV